MKFLMFLISLAAVAVNASDKPAVLPCTGSPQVYSQKDDLLQVTGWTLEPENPKSGDTLTASVIGILLEDIPDGIIDLNVTLSGVVPLQQNFKLSDVDDLKARLPLKKGPFSLTETAVLPDFIFGEVDGYVHIKTTDNRPITCVKLALDLGN